MCRVCWKSDLRGQLFAFPPDEDAEEHLGSETMLANESNDSVFRSENRGLHILP